LADAYHADLVARYRHAGRMFAAHTERSERMAARFGMAYLGCCLADDLAAELRLEDAFEEVRAELTAELMEVDVIPCGDGYYKADALGWPRFHRTVPLGVKS
jgi:hypothetical protein